MKIRRRIVKIDEEKCTGCGLCVPSCAEGAIQIIDGKARVVSEALCDGIGNCLGECPEGAISIEEREAEAFDPGLVERRGGHAETPLSGCPGSAVWSRTPGESPARDAGPSQLTNWPVQLHLLPIEAPYLRGSRLLIAADCVPFAMPDFHESLLRGHTVAIGCPKLDETGIYRQKLAEILRRNQVQSVTVAHMTVPCCHGLLRLVEDAVRDSGADVVVERIVVGIDGVAGNPPRASSNGGCPVSARRLTLDHPA